MKRLFSFVLILSAVAMAAWLIWAGNPSILIPREVLFDLPEKTSPQISSDGSFVAYLAPHQKVLNVWIYDRKTRKERVLTHDSGRGIHYYAWAPEGKSILFLQDQGGNENWHLYKADLSGSPARDLTPFEGVQARVLEIDRHFPAEILIELNKENASWHDVYRLDLKTGGLEIVARNTGKISDWIVDAAMKVRGAVGARTEGGHDVMIRDNEGSEWRKLFSWDLEDSMTSSVVGFSKSGKELYLIDSRGRDKASLAKMDLVTGREVMLYSDPDYDVGAVSVDPEDRQIEMVSVYRTRSEWIALCDSVRKDLQHLRNIGSGDLIFGSRSYDDRYWVVGFDSDVSPTKYYVYDRKNGKAEFLFAHRPALLKYKLASMEAITIKSRDGLGLQGYLTLPNRGKKPFPMVLLVHGGPWTRDGWGYDPTVQWLADRGYACLQINFRGSTGFGKKFLNAGNKEWGRKMQDDLSDAVAWAVLRGIADPKRMGIMGASYGGYAALAAAAFTPEVFRCAVDMFGPSDLAALIRAMPPYWSVEKNNIMRRMGDPDAEPAFLKERSPIFFTDKVRIPLLIAQGANDPRTPKSESDRMVQALRHRKIECEYVVFPDEGHGFAKPASRLRFYKIAETFLARHLGGRCQK